MTSRPALAGFLIAGALAGCVAGGGVASAPPGDAPRAVPLRVETGAPPDTAVPAGSSVVFRPCLVNLGTQAVRFASGVNPFALEADWTPPDTTGRPSFPDPLDDVDTFRWRERAVLALPNGLAEVSSLLISELAPGERLCLPAAFDGYPAVFDRPGTYRVRAVATLLNDVAAPRERQDVEVRSAPVRVVVR